MKIQLELTVPPVLIDKLRPKYSHGEVVDVPLRLHPEVLFGVHPFDIIPPFTDVCYSLRFHKYLFRCDAGHEQFAWFLLDEKPEINDACTLCVCR